jgi:hypothetical protein
LISLKLIGLMFNDVYKLWFSSLCNIHQPLITSSVLRANIIYIYIYIKDTH